MVLESFGIALVKLSHAHTPVGDFAKTAESDPVGLYWSLRFSLLKFLTCTQQCWKLLCQGSGDYAVARGPCRAGDRTQDSHMQSMWFSSLSYVSYISQKLAVVSDVGGPVSHLEQQGFEK